MFGANMEVQQLDVLRKLMGISLLSQALGICGGCLQIHNMDTLNNCMGRIVHTVGPVGFGDNASPVIINQKSFLETGQGKTRLLKALMALETKE